MSRTQICCIKTFINHTSNNSEGDERKYLCIVEKMIWASSYLIEMHLCKYLVIIRFHRVYLFKRKETTGNTEC